MATQIIQREQFLPVSLSEAWDFISDPRNLSRITPPALDFKIVSRVPVRIHEGLVIEYRVKPFLGVPVKWISLIQDIQRPFGFSDIQVQGPYTRWHHDHYLREVPGGVLMQDTVRYEIFLTQILPWIDTRFVQRRLRWIFDYRAKALAEIFAV